MEGGGEEGRECKYVRGGAKADVKEKGGRRTGVKEKGERRAGVDMRRCYTDLGLGIGRGS